MGGCKCAKMKKCVSFADEVIYINNFLSERTVNAKRAEVAGEVAAADFRLAQKDYRRLFCKDDWPFNDEGDGLSSPLKSVIMKKLWCA